MSEHMIAANGIEICTEAFGNPNDVPILLVMGATSSMLMWREGFIDQLVAGGRFVIRYDNRDTGKSSCFDFEQEPYTVSDMAVDAVGVLDAYDIESAHAVGPLWVDLSFNTWRLIIARVCERLRPSCLRQIRRRHLPQLAVMQGIRPCRHPLTIGFRRLQSSPSWILMTFRPPLNSECGCWGCCMAVHTRFPRRKLGRSSRQKSQGVEITLRLTIMGSRSPPRLVGLIGWRPWMSRPW